MERYDYFIKRLLLIIPTFIGITFVCFALCQFVPGGPIEQKLRAMRGGGTGEGGGAPAQAAEALTDEHRQQLIEAFGFDKPLPVRYWDWLWNKKIGLDTYSYKWPGEKVWKLIVGRFRVSLIFGITSLILTYLICIPLGIGKALRDGKPFDVASSLIIFVGYAIPGFAFGMLLKMFFCGTVDGLFDLFPLAGFEASNFAQLGLWAKFTDRVQHMFLPLLCYMVGNFAVLTLLMEIPLLEQISQDYMRTVGARGGSFTLAVWGHALRNSLIPIITGIGGIFTVMFAGSILIERVFEIPGMGKLGYEAIVNRDYAVFMGILAITSVLGLIGNIFRDLCYVLVDPRINFQKT